MPKRTVALRPQIQAKARSIEATLLKLAYLLNVPARNIVSLQGTLNEVTPQTIGQDAFCREASLLTSLQ